MNVFEWNSDEYRIIVRAESETKRKKKKKKRKSKKRKRNEKKIWRMRRREDQCGICLNSYSENLGLPVSCSHVFCFECISKWTKITNSCPSKNLVFKNFKVTTSKHSAVSTIPSSRRKKRKECSKRSCRRQRHYQNTQTQSASCLLRR